MINHDHASHAGQSHANWLKYSNQGATRNDPIAPALVTAMSFLPELGITMDVISGGQESNKPGEGTGSTRHNHGNSADVDFYKDGRKLDWNNPDDLPMLQRIVSTAKSRGVTGIGAGDDYMGPGRFHIGFGAPAVWGAGGKSSNAPEWLRVAYGAAPQGKAPDDRAQAAAPQEQAPGNDYTRLAYAYANGKMTPEDEAVYERGMADGVFPKAAKSAAPALPDPLAGYAAQIAARRQQQQPQMQPFQYAAVQNATPLKKYSGI